MGNYDTEVRVSTKVETSQMQKLQIQIDKACDKVEALTKKYDELKNKKIPTQEYVNLENRLKSAKDTLASLIAEEEKLSNAGLAIGAPWDNVIQKEADAQLKIEAIEAEMQKLVDTGKAFTIGADREEINNAFNDLERAKAELRMLVTKMDELGAKPVKISDGLKKIGSAAKRAFGAISSGTKKSSGLLTLFLGKIKSIALAVFVFNVIKKAFDAMIELMKKGFENFSNYSNDFANSIQGIKNAASTLGNQISAAFVPIVQLVIPWLTQLINAISNAMTYVAQFIAVLGGKSTFTRAKQVQDSYNKSLGGTAKAADKARGALAKFDDLDVLQKKEDTGAGGGADAVGDMFEEVPVDSKFKDWLDGILEKLKPILGYFNKLKDIFMEGFWDGLGDWEYRLDIIKKGLEQIKNALIDIWTDPEVLSSANAWAESLMYMLGTLTGSVASIGLTIAAAFIGGLGQYMEDHVERIKGFLISAFDIGAEINYLLADLFQSVAYIFEAFASESGIRFISALIGSIADAGIGLAEIALKLGRDVLEMIILPITENKDAFRTALEGLLSVGATILEGFKESIDSIFDNLNIVYNAHFKPFFDSIAIGLSGIIGKFLEFWNGTVQPILDGMAKRFSELLTKHITPLVNSAINLLGSVADLLKTLWEQWLKPIVGWVIDNILPVLVPILETLYNTVITVLGDIADFFSGFYNTVKSIIDLIVNLINGDWAGAWESAKGIIENAFNTILAFTQAIWDSFVGIIHNMLQIIVGIIQVTFLGIYDFLVNIWNNIYESTLGIWTTIMEWFIESFNSFHEFIVYILESITLFFIETWESIQLLFENFIAFIIETLIPMWQESWENASNLFQTFHDLLIKLSNAIKDLFTGLMKSVKLLIDGDWKGAWENAKNIFNAFKSKVDEIIKVIRGIIQSFFDWVMGIISEVFNAIESIGNVVSGFFGGGKSSDGGKNSSGESGRSFASYSAQNFAAYTADLPYLASGSVIRGGNPFMAVLGDQPHGQTNIEAPLATIEQAVENVMSRSSYAGERVPVNINLNYDGETFARVSIPDILSELARQGYDVDVLGVN